MSSSQLFERPRSGERAILVHAILGQHANADLDEFGELARSAGADILAVLTTARQAPDSRYFIGQGKAEEVHQAVANLQAEIVLFNHSLTPSQQRNLEQLFGCRVLDRTGLILDIFAQRARTFEGKLQVELAQLKHIATRLVRGWTHLERQKGGIGLRGPGETQLETDRRLVGERIKQLEKRLEKVARRRELSRQARSKADVHTVSFVGYTNAGKSTLFNRLTGAEVYVANQLFATLDPTLRSVQMPLVGDLVIADTVGFIRDLPHHLVAAFRSTLEETREADLLLHVVDISDENSDVYIQQVNAVLTQIGAEKVPCIMVFNKIDKAGITARQEIDAAGEIAAIYLSAVTGEGLEILQDALKVYFQKKTIQGWIILQPHQGRHRARFYEQGEILQENVDAQGRWIMEIRIERDKLGKIGFAAESVKPMQSQVFEPEIVAADVQPY